MSKKLIAIAAAAALALTGLVASPAMASPVTVTVADNSSDDVSGTTTKTTAATNDFNEDNELVFGTTAGVSTRTVVEFTVANPSATSSKITVSAASGVKLLTELVDADEEPLANGAGSSSLTGTDSTNTNDFVFYAYTTSTTAGSVAITANGNTAVHYVVAEAGAAYNLVNVKFPTSITAGVSSANSEDIVTFDITDVFGNKLIDAASDVIVDVVGADNGVADYTAKKRYEVVIYEATGGPVAISLDLDADSLSSVGYPKPKDTAFSTTSAADLATQVASLKAQLANTVSKAKYNNLVKKYNKITRGKKAKLVK